MLYGDYFWGDEKGSEIDYKNDYISMWNGLFVEYEIYILHTHTHWESNINYHDALRTFKNCETEGNHKRELRRFIDMVQRIEGSVYLRGFSPVFRTSG